MRSRNSSNRFFRTLHHFVDCENKKGRAKRPVPELRLLASLLSQPTVWNTGHRRF